MHSGWPPRASAAPDVAREVALRVEGRCAGREEPEAVPAWGSLLLTGRSPPLTVDPSCPQCTLALFVSSEHYFVADFYSC